jgi:p-hydroxybenzoate 3-monooxygenase
MLSHMLHRAGIDSVVLERGNVAHIGTRMRAGGLEHGTVALMKEVGLGQRMQELGMTVRATEFRFDNAGHRIEFEALTGHTFTIYPQYEIVADLLNARTNAQGPVLFETAATRIEGVDGEQPIVHFESEGKPETLVCDFVAGCDGYHGVSRNTIPASIRREFEEVYPFGWLGILAEVPPETAEVAYACHDRGFAMSSFRTPEMSRMYLQCPPDDRAENWSDDRIWSELHARLDVPDRPQVREGAIVQKSVTAMRNFVTEPMSYGRLFLAGDAAHIVPPTGAKGLNSAMFDATLLARAMIEHYRDGRPDALANYSAACLKRTWQVQRFSADMCTSLHRFPNASDFAHRVQRAHLEYLTSTDTGRRWYAENFVGLPF